MKKMRVMLTVMALTVCMSALTACSSNEKNEDVGDVIQDSVDEGKEIINDTIEDAKSGKSEEEIEQNVEEKIGDLAEDTVNKLDQLSPDGDTAK